MRLRSRKAARASISVRINPNVDPKTHPYISTGLKGNKFGVAHDRAVAIYQHAASLKGLKVVGIDCHIGSQITDASPYLEALERVLDLVEAIEKTGIALHHLDFGGGLGIDYNGDTPPAADALWQQLLARLDARGFGRRRLIVEPGRSLVGNAGVLRDRGALHQARRGQELLHRRCGDERPAAAGDVPGLPSDRPGVSERTGAMPSPTTWSGPVCESGDWIGRDRALQVQAGRPAGGAVRRRLLHGDGQQLQHARPRAPRCW